MSPSERDAIRKQVVVKAARSRVWKALVNSDEFGEWFRADLAGEFKPGAHVIGHSTYPGLEDHRFDIEIQEIVPETLFSFRWHPHERDNHLTRSERPTTLVEFRLEDVPEGTLVTVIESGFDALPDEYRDESFRENTSGWEEQMDNIRQHFDE